jgi:hypothetical protein
MSVKGLLALTGASMPSILRLSVLFAVVISLPTMSSASVIDAIPNATFSVETPDLSNLVTTEGSGTCSPSGCDSLNLEFAVTNQSDMALDGFTVLAPTPTFVSGDPTDSFIKTLVDASSCEPEVLIGDSCVVRLSYITSPPPREPM